MTLAYQDIPWMHCHPIYEYPFPEEPVMILLLGRSPAPDRIKGTNNSMDASPKFFFLTKAKDK